MNWNILRQYGRIQVPACCAGAAHNSVYQFFISPPPICKLGRMNILPVVAEYLYLGVSALQTHPMLYVPVCPSPKDSSQIFTQVRYRAATPDNSNRMQNP